jgi:subtilisin family serine protease
MPHVLSIAATGPVGWVVNPGADLDVPASYTNFGQSRIDFAAPGGNEFFLTKHPEVGCSVFGMLLPCGGLDFVFTTVPGGWALAKGTSMAAPHASGIAALIVGKYGHMKPAELEAKLRDAAVDMGTPGKDAYFGQGFLDPGALQGLPNTQMMYMYLLQLPALAPEPYQLVELDWNPGGHPSPAV